MPNPALSGQTVPASSFASLKNRATSSIRRLCRSRPVFNHDYGIKPGLQDNPERLGGRSSALRSWRSCAFLTGSLFVIVGTIIFYLNIIGRYEARIVPLGKRSTPDRSQCASSMPLAA